MNGCSFQQAQHVLEISYSDVILEHVVIRQRFMVFLLVLFL